MRELITIAGALTLLVAVNVLTTQWGMEAAYDLYAWAAGVEQGISPSQVVQLSMPDGIAIGEIGTFEGGKFTPLAIEDRVCAP